MFITEKQKGSTSDKKHPLKLWICTHCWLVQQENIPEAEDIYRDDYVSLSSVSSTVQNHVENLCSKLINEMNLTSSSKVMEIASNDGYLLQNLVKVGIPCFGIEPSHIIAEIAEEKGVRTYNSFFNSSFADVLLIKEGKQELIIGNHVLEHIPDIKDFLDSIKKLLSSRGSVIIEVPNLLPMIKDCQFDIIFHQHHYYFSLIAMLPLFRECGFKIYDAEELELFGGSLRVYATHKENHREVNMSRIEQILKSEMDAGLNSELGYLDFNKRAEKIQKEFNTWFSKTIQSGKSICAYGASHKAVPFLHFVGIHSIESIPFIVDKSVHKHGRFLPISHIPIVDESILRKEKPEFILILPWNLKDEIVEQLQYAREWGAKFVVAMPHLKVY